uniref:Uncharacterized protein n=1 Tax=Kalanchoe fedtschenkoi TaxID=63787 RepID=A0A7N0TPJ1_KALFE
MVCLIIFNYSHEFLLLMCRLVIKFVIFTGKKKVQRKRGKTYAGESSIKQKSSNKGADLWLWQFRRKFSP